MPGPLTKAIVMLFLCGCGTAVCPADTEAAPPLILYVAPDGSDTADGLSPRTALATPVGARDRLRRLRSEERLPPSGARVLFADGVYTIDEPLVLLPEDSGTRGGPIVYAAIPGTRPLISGGKRLPALQPAANGVWTAQVPEAAFGGRPFRQLFIDGRRYTLARSPNSGYYYVAGAAHDFIAPTTGRTEAGSIVHDFRFPPGSLRDWPDLEDINLVVFHLWETSTLPLKWVDEEQGVAHTDAHCRWGFPPSYFGNAKRFIVENAPDALDAPGEWRFDRRTGRLSVIPFDGHDLAAAEVIAPVATQLLVLAGEPRADRFVEHIRFEGLRFEHAEWLLPATGISDPQAAVSVPAAVEFRGARECAMTACDVAHVGTHAIRIATGSCRIHVERCHLYDLGGGGVYIGRGDQHVHTGNIAEDARDRVTANRLVNCFIHDGGLIHRSAHGVWIGHSSDNRVAHNRIAYFNYTGISIGWSWGYAETESHRNTVEYNHLHDLGQNCLSDMAGIYTLGDSPGTVVRHNLIHDIWSHAAHHAAGIYPDEGSRGILYEHNIVYRVSGRPFSIHYGRNLVVRNNILALPADDRSAIHCGLRGRQGEVEFVFQRNIVYYDQPRIFSGTGRLTDPDGNIYWRRGGEPVVFPGRRTFEEWQGLGNDPHSVVADPLFVDAEAGDFRLRPGSPAQAVGFEPIDASLCGLTGDPEWTSLPERVLHAPPETVPYAEQAGWHIDLPLVEDFESLDVGHRPRMVHVFGATADADILVSDDRAASGRHSLKVTDSAEDRPEYQPHMVYGFTDVVLERGEGLLAFDLWRGPDSELLVEWRDGSFRWRVGPSLRVAGDGALRTGDRMHADLPAGTWLHFEIRSVVGHESDGRWSLRVESDGQVLVDIPDLTCDPDFDMLTWLGFCSTARRETVFYLDNLRIEEIVPHP